MRIMKSKIEHARWVSLSAVLSFAIAGCGGNASQDKIPVPPSSYAPVVAPLPAVSSNPQSGATPKLSAAVSVDFNKESANVAEKAAQYSAQPLTDVLSGSVYHWATGAMLANTELTLKQTDVVSNATADASGNYTFTGVAAGAYALSAQHQASAADLDRTISSADALAALKMAVGLNPNSDPDGSGPQQALPVSPYQLIAADMNGDGRVTSADALAILKVAVGLSDAVTPEWKLMAQSLPVWDSHATSNSSYKGTGELEFTFPDTTTAHFVAVLTGDVNASWSAPAGSAAMPVDSYYQLASELGAPLSIWGLRDARDTTAPVLTLLGDAVIEIDEGTAFNDLGASAVDDVDGALTVTVTGQVSGAPGVYTLTYSVADLAGNVASVTREVRVIAAPVTGLAVISAGTPDALWDGGIMAFDGALDYKNCGMTGDVICQSMSWQTVADAERGDVLEVAHGQGAALAGLFISAKTPVDLRSYASGAIVFDIKVVSGDSRITMKLDCIHPCTSGDQALGSLPVGEWQTVTVALSDLVTGGLDLSKVDTGLVIWATGHNGTVFRLDNIRFTETIVGTPWDLGGGSGGGTGGGPVTTDYVITSYGAGSVSDTINKASYRCVYDFGNWIYSAGIVLPGIGGCDTTTGTPIGEPAPILPNLVEPAASEPTPTHKWWGSVPFLGEMAIGDPNRAAYITPDPLTVRITNGGFRAMGIPNGMKVVNQNEFAYPIPDPFGEVMDGIAIGHSSGTNLQGYLKDHSDGSVTVQWQSNGTPAMEATFIHGSPYVYIKVLTGELRIKTLREDGGEKGTFYDKNNSLGVWTSVAGNHNNYVITGEGATTFSNITTSVISASNAANEFTLTYLPQTSGIPSDAMADFFVQRARNVVAKVTIDYSVDRATNDVTVQHSYVDSQGTLVDTITGMHPLHWKYAGVTNAPYSVRSARGVIQFVPQSQFSYTMPYVGVLPALPSISASLSEAELKAKVDAFIAQGESAWNTNGQGQAYRDAYWSGKNYSKVAELIAIARDAGFSSEADRLTAWLKTELEDWFAAETDGALDVDKYFMFDKNWNTLLAMEESFASHQNLNDHHFHYGYIVRAAAEICRNDRAWCGQDQYGPMIELLIRDYAAGRDDPMFPYLRHFDPANGFSWASGNVNFARGNNNESTSEAANAYGAMVLFGLITGNDEMTERGMYLHASTSATYWEYWNNIDGYNSVSAQHDNFPPGYDKISTSIIWADGAVFSTWFSGAFAHILGIQGLPSNPLIMHVGLHSDYMRDYVSLGLSESSNGKPSGLPNDQWRDLWWNLWALADANAALADYETMPNYTPEQGESLAHTYHWLHNMNTLGQLKTGLGEIAADYPGAMVFDNQGVKRYVVYNFGQDATTVNFNDGVSIQAVAEGFTVEVR
ncbi:MAG: glycosyl hydrolase [Aequoribacter sp.]|uniref:glycosyl hydrolase n=1 Tax=Aequoribacter sp. TaxID=2847771 RepID=UPI003C64D316